MVNFGTLVCEDQLTSQTFSITNTGTKVGYYKLEADTMPKVFTVIPNKGRIAPGETVELKVRALKY